MAKKKDEPEPQTLYQYHPDGSAAPDDRIFVFGSNLAGYHGAGAARAAHQFYGAVLGREGAVGPQGRSYAIPTKNQWLETLKVEEIEPFVNQFVEFTKANPELKFFVTAVGCGLAGLTAEDMAPMFAEAQNCTFPDVWAYVMEDMIDVEVPEAE